MIQHKTYNQTNKIKVHVMSSCKNSNSNKQQKKNIYTQLIKVQNVKCQNIILNPYSHAFQHINLTSEEYVMQLVSLSCPYNDTALFTPFSHRILCCTWSGNREHKHKIRYEICKMLIQFSQWKFYAPMVTRVFEQFTLSRLW